jgi:hypothetical protein
MALPVATILVVRRKRAQVVELRLLHRPPVHQRLEQSGSTDDIPRWVGIQNSHVTSIAYLTQPDESAPERPPSAYVIFSNRQ